MRSYLGYKRVKKSLLVAIHFSSSFAFNLQFAGVSQLRHKKWLHFDFGFIWTRSNFFIESASRAIFSRSRFSHERLVEKRNTSHCHFFSSLWNPIKSKTKSSFFSSFFSLYFFILRYIVIYSDRRFFFFAQSSSVSCETRGINHRWRFYGEALKLNHRTKPLRRPNSIVFNCEMCSMIIDAF